MAQILLIEDNLSIRENTVELLELSGYEVFSAENGTVGLSMAREYLPDLILCDIMMPEVDGYEVIRQLKSDPATSAIPFVFATASAEKSEMRMGLEMGAADYLRKPFDEKELLNSISKCLDVK